MTRSTARPPTALTRVWVRSLIGFSVGVAVGLAPYLGVTGVPLFTPLLELIPSTARHTTIPLSAALMGLVAMWVQWYGADKLSDRCPASVRVKISDAVEIAVRKWTSGTTSGRTRIDLTVYHMPRER